MGLLSLDRDADHQNLKGPFDVVVIGSGAGGGLSALHFSKMGKRVLLVEMGPGLTTKDFELNEAKAYENLYQQAASRKTKDGTINILQGRTLGGGTTVNWTSSFRTPERTLRFWQREFGLKEFSLEKMETHFQRAEKLINVSEWKVAPNRNNSLLEEGLKNLNYSYGRISRNVKGCQNLGYCGLGCPVGAKQSALVTTIKRAKDQGIVILCDALAHKLILDKRKVKAIVLKSQKTSQHILIEAKKFILSAGAIGSPAILMRSGVPDPHELIGKRTFLHPTTISGALYDEEVEPYYGAPQSIYSDHFISPIPEKKPGYKLEVPPIHPLLYATTLPFWGKKHAELMKALPHLGAMIALQRDGFHPESPGGQVFLTKDGEPLLDYPITSYMAEGFRESLLTMGEIQFSSGAREVMPLHKLGKSCRTLGELRKLLKTLTYDSFSVKVVSAHVMGGCPMGLKEEDSVVNSSGKLHTLDNLWIHDGSVFPTSVGTNPMISILATTNYFLSQHTLS